MERKCERLAVFQVFFSGDPWLLQCSNENATITEAFAGASRRLSVTSSVHVGAIDCGGKLPSNRTFFQRFKLPPVNFTKTPTGYLFSNTDPPQQVSASCMLQQEGVRRFFSPSAVSDPGEMDAGWGETGGLGREVQVRGRPVPEATSTCCCEVVMLRKMC